MSLHFEFENLTGGYGDTKVVFELSGHVKGGQVLGLFGRNGVGKTTLAKLLQGELSVTSGKITLDNLDLSLMPPYLRRAHGVGYMPQTGMVFDNLSVRENLSLAKSDQSLDYFFELFPRLAERFDQQAGSMSGGERKILSFVRTMVEDSQVIILDEPSEGVQPENIAKMESCLIKRKQTGSAVILIEQNLSMLRNVSDHLIGIDSGRIKVSKDIQEISRDDMLNILSV